MRPKSCTCTCTCSAGRRSRSFADLAWREQAAVRDDGASGRGRATAVWRIVPGSQAEPGGRPREVTRRARARARTTITSHDRRATSTADGPRPPTLPSVAIRKRRKTCSFGVDRKSSDVRRARARARRVAGRDRSPTSHGASRQRSGMAAPQGAVERRLFGGLLHDRKQSRAEDREKLPAEHVHVHERRSRLTIDVRRARPTGHDRRRCRPSRSGSAVRRARLAWIVNRQTSGVHVHVLGGSPVAIVRRPRMARAGSDQGWRRLRARSSDGCLADCCTIASRAGRKTERSYPPSTCTCTNDDHVSRSTCDEHGRRATIAFRRRPTRSGSAVRRARLAWIVNRQTSGVHVHVLGGSPVAIVRRPHGASGSRSRMTAPCGRGQGAVAGSVILSGSPRNSKCIVSCSTSCPSQ